jgi:hypothetical protein
MFAMPNPLAAGHAKKKKSDYDGKQLQHNREVH